LHSDSVVQVCRDFIRGECERGSSCPYHHMLNYRGPVADPCRDYQRGLCEMGNACPHAHVPEYVEICRLHMRGSCPRGSACHFHHLPTARADDESMDISDSVRPSKRTKREGGGAPKRERERDSSSKGDLDEELDVAAKNRDLSDENKSLREENSSLRSENASLRSENIQLRDKIERLSRQNLNLNH